MIGGGVLCEVREIQREINNGKVVVIWLSGDDREMDFSNYIKMITIIQ